MFHRESLENLKNGGMLCRELHDEIMPIHHINRMKWAKPFHKDVA